MVSGLTNGTGYAHRVRGKNGGSHSAWTAYISTIAGVRPSVPANLMGASANESVRLDWNDAANAAGYEVQQWDGHADPARWRTLPFTGNRSFTIDFNGSSAVVGGLKNGISYAYSVRGKTGALESLWTDYVTTSALAPTATHTPTSTPRAPIFSVYTTNPVVGRRIVLKVEAPAGGNAHFGGIS